MARKKIWSKQDDNYLIDNFCLTNMDLAKNLNVSETLIRNRYAELGVDRPTGKNNLSRARSMIYRERSRGLVPEDWHELPATRADARIIGNSYYWDGQPCDRSGHISRRKTFSGGCLECEINDLNKRRANDQEFKNREAELRRERYKINREEYLINQKEYKDSEKFREWSRRYHKKKRQEDMEWVLRKSLRDRFYHALTKGTKADSAVRLIGCTIRELKNYLEEKFTEGMSWENYGKWHIDHIRPCISFDLTDHEQQRQCFHYTNLQPLWGYENQSKGGVWNGVDPRANPAR